MTIDKSGANTAAIDSLLAGIETMHMIRKGQWACPNGQAASAAKQIYSLAF